MSRWRKVDVRLWGDERVRKLSRPQPSGLVCWLYLLTARESTALPGAIPAGPATIAESLGWSRPAFLRCFNEIQSKGMASADWEVGLVWLPKALRYNPPQSPNAVKAWAKAWDELPDCELKSMIRQHTEAFLKAFDKALDKDSGKGFLKVFMEVFTYTEAEEEAEAEAEADPDSKKEAEDREQPGAASPKGRSEKKPSEQQQFAEYFEKERREALNGSYSEDRQLPIKRLNSELQWVKEAEAAIVQDAVRLYLADEKRRQQDPPCCLLWFSRDRAEYLSKAKREIE